MKTILITGVAGFIGRNLANSLSRNYNIIGIDIEDFNNPFFCKFYKLDIRNKKELKKVFYENKIDIVIHSAAIKSLKQCEENKKEANETNYLATKLIYELSKKINAKFIFISSDQVFDGKEGEYKEDSKTNPINYYGHLKVLCEQMLIKDPKVAICRTAMVFGDIPETQLNFFNKIKEEDYLVVQGYIIDHVIYRLTNRKKINLPENEFCCPTSNNLLYTQIKLIIEKNLVGLFHCCGGEKVSRYEFGKEIAEVFNLNPYFIDHSSSHDLLRPKDVSLNSEKTQKELNISFPNIKNMIKEIKMGKDFKKIKEYVKKEFDIADIRVYNQAYFYEHHILPVFNIGIKLAEKYNANKLVIGVSSLLHDIGLIGLPEGKEHNVAGAEKIEEIFKALNLNVDQEFIDKIRECILYHYGRKGDNKNQEIKVLITADALAHVTTPFLFVKYKISKKSFEDYKKWMIRKIDQDCERVCFEDEKKEIEEYAKILKKMLSENES